MMSTLGFKASQSRVSLVGPGLAQLEERLTDRYSESTSSNPGQPHLCNSMWGQKKKEVLCHLCRKT